MLTLICKETCTIVFTAPSMIKPTSHTVTDKVSSTCVQQIPGKYNYRGIFIHTFIHTAVRWVFFTYQYSSESLAKGPTLEKGTQLIFTYQTEK